MKTLGKKSTAKYRIGERVVYKNEHYVVAALDYQIETSTWVYWLDPLEHSDYQVFLKQSSIKPFIPTNVPLKPLKNRFK